MRVLGIDPGTAIVGYGIIDYEKGNYKTLDYGCIYTDKDLEMPKRLNKIYTELDSLIKLYKPDFVGVEELFYFKNNKTIISVGQARGVILLAIEQNNISSVGYTPLQVKMGITGYGRAEKKQVQEMVARVLKLEEIPKPDDAADALAVAITHIHSLSNLLGGNGADTSYSKINIKSKKGKSNKISLAEYKKIMK